MVLLVPILSILTSIIVPIFIVRIMKIFPTRWIRYVVAPLLSSLIFIVLSAAIFYVAQNSFGEYAKVTEGLGITLILGPVLLLALPLSLLLPIVFLWRLEKSGA